MYIEYLGIPGCGKTYHVTKYKEQLVNEGKAFLDISRQKLMPLWLKIFYKIAELFLLLLPKYKKQTQEYEEVCKGCLAVPKYLPFSLAYCIKDIVLASLLHDVFHKRKKIILNDEGQLQRIVFLVVQYDVSLNRVLSVYSKFKSDVKTLFIDTDIEVAFENIKRRNRHVCPMDEMADEELKQYLYDFYKNCIEVNAMIKK